MLRAGDPGVAGDAVGSKSLAGVPAIMCAAAVFFTRELSSSLLGRVMRQSCHSTVLAAVGTQIELTGLLQ